MAVAAGRMARTRQRIHPSASRLGQRSRRHRQRRRRQDLPAETNRSAPIRTAVPPYTISDGHGGCSGSDGSYTPKNNIPTRPASGSATAGTTSDAAGRVCPPDKPIGAYPNCCPRYMISDGHGGCSGSDTVQRGGISYDRSGKPIIPSRAAIADPIVKARDLSTNKRVVPNQTRNEIQQWVVPARLRWPAPAGRPPPKTVRRVASFANIDPTRDRQRLGTGSTDIWCNDR